MEVAAGNSRSDVEIFQALTSTARHGDVFFSLSQDQLVTELYRSTVRMADEADAAAGPSRVHVKVRFG